MKLSLHECECGWTGQRRNGPGRRPCPECGKDPKPIEQSVRVFLQRQSRKLIEDLRPNTSNVRVTAPVTERLPKVHIPQVIEMRTTLEGKMIRFAIPPHLRPRKRRRR